MVSEKERAAPTAGGGRAMSNKRSILAKLDRLVARVEAVTEDMYSVVDALQEQIGDLEDRQAERETKARGARIGELNERILYVSEVVLELQTARDCVESAIALIDEGWSKGGINGE